MEGAPIHSGGTAPDFHRTSLFMIYGAAINQPIFSVWDCKFMIDDREKTVKIFQTCAAIGREPGKGK